MVTRFRVGEGEILLVSTVQGLVAERKRVEEILFRERPDVVALGVAPEAVAAISRYEPDPEVDPFDELPDHDLVYSHRLTSFGDVDLPPPDLVGAILWARDAGATCYGVDLSEEAYEETFTRSVSAWGFLRYGRIQRSLARKPPKANDARSFSLAWDARIRRVRGLARVEAAREEAMAAGAVTLARKGSRVLLLVDAPREAGISERLSGERE